MKKRYSILAFLIPSLFFISCCSKSDDANNDNGETPAPPEISFYRGADLSFLPMLELSNTVFYDKEGKEVNALDLMKNRGMNIVRIRLWHTPSGAQSSFEEVKAFGELVKRKGLQTWLTVHYSDFWADPGKQKKPDVWADLSFDLLKDSVFQYTKKIVQEMQPNIIQIGNETNDGFLWPEGKLSTNPQQYLELTQQGIFAVREFGSNTKIMLQFAGYEGADWFFNQTSSLDYDLIGLSYYPWWHGESMDALGNTITQLKNIHTKDVLIAETAYPFTLEWNDWTNNIIGSEDQLFLPDYPASKAGQKKFFEDLIQLVKAAEGSGYCYWAPEWIAFDGEESQNGSSWENACLFDFNSKENPALEIFFAKEE
jgi:arabinogalactan endo-1,4-beta-galactosidase